MILNIELLHPEMVQRLVKSGALILETLTPEKVNLWHAATGISGEAGELLDNIKRHVVYNKPFDRENVVEELGDLEFYMEQVRQGTGITREETLQHNHTKLADKDKGRYAQGYSDAAALNRADKQPRQ